MQTSERDAFEEQLSTLCAGFNVPVTTHRKHAYFVGLARMSLAQFARCVEFAVSDDGPDDLPTTKDVWNIHRQLRRQPSRAAQVSRRGEDPRDHLLHYANRMFLRHVQTRGGLGDELGKARTALRETVNWFVGPIREGDSDATPHAFVTALVKALGKVSPIDPAALREWELAIKDAKSLVPFPPYMGREIPATPRQLEMA